MSIIYDLFYESVKKEPEKISVICKNQAYTYQQLSYQCDQYANKLFEVTQGEKRLIAVSVSRSFEYIACILSILRCGCTYLPIDQDLPRERILSIFKISKTSLLITSNRTRDSYIPVEQIAIDELVAKQEYEMNPKQHLEDDAYLIFTSGSSGISKGVEISNQALLSFIRSFSERIHIEENTSILAISSYSFDISFVELFLPLFYGMQIILANDIERKSPKKLWKLIQTYKPEVIQITPSYLRFLLTYEDEDTTFETTKKIILGGERINWSLVELLQRYKKLRIFNAYGPTEATIWCSVGELTNCNYVHAGTPLSNTKLAISEEEELLIGGECLFSGYYHDKVKTKEKMINYEGGLYYRSGDLVKRSDSGEYIILGRVDNQVKIDGHRIELEDIECNINENFEFENCAVDYDNHRLILYYAGTQSVTRKELFDRLNMKLPVYMIPSQIYQLDHIPLNSNGKTDRIALRRLEKPS
ncbi:MAG TPA: amino acid adenylation domain-containing protein [Mobilitalea sp.]|nr:amino acid adenylation domain-containing protein [Mobilitalea sp.]